MSRGKPLPHSLSDEQKRKVGLTRDTWKLEVVSDPDNPGATNSYHSSLSHQIEIQDLALPVNVCDADFSIGPTGCREAAHCHSQCCGRSGAPDSLSEATPSEQPPPP